MAATTSSYNRVAMTVELNQFQEIMKVSTYMDKYYAAVFTNSYDVQIGSQTAFNPDNFTPFLTGFTAGIITTDALSVNTTSQVLASNVPVYVNPATGNRLVRAAATLAADSNAASYSDFIDTIVYNMCSSNSPTAAPPTFKASASNCAGCRNGTTTFAAYLGTVMPDTMKTNPAQAWAFFPYLALRYIKNNANGISSLDNDLYKIHYTRIISLAYMQCASAMLGNIVLGYASNVNTITSQDAAYRAVGDDNVKAWVVTIRNATSKLMGIRTILNGEVHALRDLTGITSSNYTGTDTAYTKQYSNPDFLDSSNDLYLQYKKLSDLASANEALTTRITETKTNASGHKQALQTGLVAEDVLKRDARRARIAVYSWAGVLVLVAVLAAAAVCRPDDPRATAAFYVAALIALLVMLCMGLYGWIMRPRLQ